MKGFVPTPAPVVDLMVGKLFRRLPPRSDATLLDPGCGRGAFIEGVIRWCTRSQQPLPAILGIEADPRHVAYSADRFAGLAQVQIRQADFLNPSSEHFDYIIGNPPYVPITALTSAERDRYRSGYAAAKAS